MVHSNPQTLLTMALTPPSEEKPTSTLFFQISASLHIQPPTKNHLFLCHFSLALNLPLSLPTGQPTREETTQYSLNQTQFPHSLPIPTSPTQPQTTPPNMGTLCTTNLCAPLHTHTHLGYHQSLPALTLHSIQCHTAAPT